MKKYFATAVLTIVMVFALTCQVHAWGDDTDNSINNGNHGTIQDNGSIVSKNNRGIINTGDVGCDNGAVVGGDVNAYGGDGGKGGKGGKGGDGGSVDIGDITITDGDQIVNDGDQIVNDGDQIVGDQIVNDGDVIINNPDELKVNSQLNPMAGQQLDTLDYNGETREDHKYQDEILEFLLAAEGPKPFKVRERGFFTRKSAHSTSKDLSVKEYDETTTVYVFRNIADLEANIKNYSIVGYADTFSKGKASLIDCFDQAVIDSGEQGGNILVILDVGYINALKSTTTGLGGSGASGFMTKDQASVFGAALGYASSKATPETDPFIHGMVLYSPDLPAENE